MTLHAYLEQFLFDAVKQRQKVSSLSGGERARVALAKLLAGSPNVLMLDEPTNDLDILTLTALEDMLSDFPGVVLAISHDRYFLNRVATSILAVERNLEGPSRATLYPGGYDDYVRLKQEQAEKLGALAKIQKLVSVSLAPLVDVRRNNKLSYRDQRDYETIMDRIAAAEERVAMLEGELLQPEVYAHATLALEKNTALKLAEVEVATLVARWEALEAMVTPRG
jgi:ABC transport system ATP-binding/permease protein